MSRALRPLGFGEILDAAFTLYRRNFSVFFGIALLLQIPTLLFWLLAPVFVGAGANTAFMQAAPVMLMPYTLFILVWTMAALTAAAGTAAEGDRPRIGSALGHGIRRFLSVAVVTVLVSISVFFGLILLIVPGLILIAMWFAVYPAAVLEKRGPLSALGRSRQLSRGARLRILGITIIAWFITMLPSMAMWVFAGVAGGMTALGAGALEPGADVGMAGLIQAASIIVSSLTLPFLLIVTTLLYFDRRARTEAPDLESAADALHAERY